MTHALLYSHFREEWETLALPDRERVAADFIAASDDECVNGTDYARRIGRGNLASYAACLAVGEARRAREGA